MVTKDVVLDLGLRREAPVTRPRAVGSFLVPLLLAALGGFAVGFAPQPAMLLGAAAVLGTALLVRLEWAALAVVASAVFEDYLALADPRATKLLAVVLVASWLVRRSRGPLRGPGHPLAGARSHGRAAVLGAVLVLVVVLLVATVLHPNGPTGAAVLARWAGFVVVLLVLVDAMRGPLAPRTVARVYVLACAAAAVCGLVTYLVGADRRVGGPIGDPNDLGFFLLAAIPLGTALRAGARRPWVYDVAVALSVAAVLGTLSRGALLGLVVAVAVAVASRQLSWRAVVALAVAGGTTVALALSLFPQLVEVSLDQKGAVADQNVSERLDLWESAGRMTLDAPVLGHGPGSFSTEHRDYLDRLPDSVDHDLDVAHNTYLETSAELGLVGLAAFLGLLAAGLLAARSGWRARGDRLAGGVGVALVGTAVAAVFVTEQYFLPLWLLCALAAALAREERA
ncbi:O-antigen ligase family protein [Nocardioides sp. SOB77]|uniref:O-antigen ligase family protein n=1 Tax=Nocardioides oceani TaxID=3058369 RepID=A0ABT8FI80_9ACTN|nr:O-antigen ligase family protein [Nocardioides oceani]MDN4174397.1 O-antigen ligase family protein [Nocardioides oceani]